MAFYWQKKKAIIKFVPVNEKGEIKIEEIKKLISSKTKIIAYYIYQMLQVP